MISFQPLVLLLLLRAQPTPRKWVPPNYVAHGVYVYIHSFLCGECGFQCCTCSECHILNLTDLYHIFRGFIKKHVLYAYPNAETIDHGWWVKTTDNLN